jgi:competence protein ComEC
MKKPVLLSIVILFVLLIMTAVAGCYEQPAPNPTQPTPPPAPAPPPPTPPETKGELKVHFIDVGQGDSILIDLGETEVLIDGGEKSPGVVPYLNKYVDGPLEVMVATHPHADHIGGLIAVLNAFQVEQIWHNGDTSTSKTYTEFMSDVQSEGAQVHIGRRGDKISAGELTFTILNPATLAGTTNNNSIVASLSYGNVDFLFTGDAEQEAEATMLAASDIPVPEVEILKVGHHGSRTASSKDFLAATSPEVTVYMAGKGNSYGHPHQETLDALAQICAKIYGTDVNSTIIITTDGATYTVQTTK